MQKIKYKGKEYNFYNTGEHFFRTKINLDTIDVHDGYSVFKCDDNYVYYINTKPVIVNMNSLNCNTNKFGSVFLDLDDGEKLCNIKEHIFVLKNRDFYNMCYEDAKVMSNSDDIKSLFMNYEITSYSNIYDNSNSRAIFINNVPVIINTESYDEPGISLEENASLKLTRYL